VAAIDPDHPQTAREEREQHRTGVEQIRVDRIVEQRAECGGG
jgi:hypothetical protein